MTAACAITNRPLPSPRRQIRGSRVGGGAEKPFGGSVRAGSRSQSAAAIAARSVKPAMASSASRSPAAMAIAGSVSAASAPPSGIAVWRMPSTNPRSSRANQPITARPVAPVALPAARPVRKSPTSSTAKPSAAAATHSAAAVIASPPASTTRSPMRSASMPHGTSPIVMPVATAPNTNPTSPIESANVSRNSGPSAGNPCRRTPTTAVPRHPTASTTQRYEFTRSTYDPRSAPLRGAT